MCALRFDQPDEYQEPDEDDSPSGIPERFDPGYYNGVSDRLPQVCRDCGELFLCPKESHENNVFGRYCDPCLTKLFKRMAAEFEENKQTAERLGMSVKEYCDLMPNPFETR